MKAMAITKPGVLEYREVPTPDPQPGEVLIRVKACALNHLDLYLRDGQRNLALPHVSGSDVAGEVVKVSGVSALRPGQAVVVNPAIPCGTCPRCHNGADCEMVVILGAGRQGGFAEYITVPVSQVYPKPKNLSFEEAAAFPLTFLTAWHMLVGRARLQKGETVFIWGASGGVGSAAIQIANYLGARVIAAARSKEAAQKIKAMGAADVVIYTDGSVAEQIKKLTSGTMADVVFEVVGAKTWATTLELLRPLGRVVIAGTASGDVARQDLSEIYYRQLTILGARMGTRSEFEQVLQLVEKGKLKPIVDKLYPLEKLAEAEARLEAGEQMGKVIIQAP